MKKILLLVFLFVLGKMSYSQGYPLLQSLGSDSTIVVSKGALQSRLIPIVITDTNAANAQRLKSYPGAQLYTTAGDFYIRNSNATKWILVSSGSSGSVNIYTADGTLTGNRTLTGANNNLTFTGLNKFTVSTGDTTLFNTNTFGIKGVGGVLNVEGTAAGTTSSLTLKTASDGNWTISTGQVNFNSGDLRFYDNDNGANRMIIKPSGNVGIGTETPDSLLTVNGGVYIGGGIRAPGLPTALGTKALRINAQGQISVADTTIGGGTVTSVGTNNGSGITGGPITTSGTLAIDTTNVIATKASVSSGLAGKLNISDTASMLSPYLRKADTTAMLAPYLRAIDTASLSNRINLKLNISDTASMLGNYLNNVGYGLSKVGQVASADSATLSAYYLRRKDSLTTTNPLGYVTKKILADTAAAIRSSDAGGTVTSVATNNGTGITGGTITTSGTLAIDTTVISTRAWRQKGIDSVASLPRVTSVGLTMPAAFNVSGSPVTSAGTLAVTGAGLASQYIRGDGTLADFPGGGGGGGASVSYYLNGSVNQGTFGGNTYYEMNKTPILGGGTNFTINADGYIAQFITDAGDPALLKIPGGNWNFELFFSASSGGGSPSYYVELYKYNGTTFTLIASGSTNPDVITGGTAVEAYFSTLPVPETVLTLTDRLAVRIYVTHAGRTITLHTEDNNLCQVITTFTTGITALNSLTAQVQYLTTGTSGTDFNISSLTDTHTFNLPTASATNRGALSTTDWSTFNNKIGPSDTASMLAPYLRKADTTTMLANYVNNVGYGLAKTGQVVRADSATLSNYYLRRKDSLTSTNPLGYVTKQVLADTAAAIRSADAGGTVTSVATNNGTGITGGTITTSGTLAIDTTVISTRAWRQKGIDSVAALINSNFSGTANYVSKFTGTNTLGNSQIFDNGTNVGVANALPSQKFEVGDGTQTGQQFARFNFSATNLYLGQSSGTAFGQSAGSASLILSDQNNPLAIGTNQNQPMIFGTNNSERMRVTSDGDVGIGTTSPTKKLSVQGDAIVSNDQYVDRALFLAQSGLHVGTAGYNSITSSGTSFLFTTSPPAASTRQSTVTFNGSNTYRFPDSSGTVALLQNITSSISGTTNYIPKFTSSSAIGNSIITDNGYYAGFNFTGSGSLGGQNFGVDAVGAFQNNLGSYGYRWLVNNGVNEVMRLNASGNLGIGTTSPSYKLQVEGAFGTNPGAYVSGTTYGTIGANRGASSASAGLNLYSVGSQKWFAGIYENSDNFGFYSVGTNSFPMVINYSTGNVGIGTTAPQLNLHIFTSGTSFTSSTVTYSSATSRGILLDNSAGTNQSGNAIWFANSGLYSAIASTRESTGDWGTDIRFYTHPTTITNQYDVTERMRITSGGLVLIGTTSTSGVDKVRVNNDGTTSYSTVNITNANSTANMYVGVGGSAVLNTSLQNNAYVWNAAASALVLGTSDTERMRITSGGNVLVGTTTDSGAKFQVNGTMQTGAVVTGFPLPTNYGAGKFKLSSVYTSGGINYVKIEIDGTTYTIQLQ